MENPTEDNARRESADVAKARAEGTQCVAIGAGVGGIGTVAAALGATCPLCFIAAPALIGIGIYRRATAGRKRSR